MFVTFFKFVLVLFVCTTIGQLHAMSETMDMSDDENPILITQRDHIPMTLRTIAAPSIHLKDVLESVESPSYIVVNAHSIAEFLRDNRVSPEYLSMLSSVSLNSLYSEYIRSHTPTPGVESASGWEVVFCYVTIINRAPLVIQISPKPGVSRSDYSEMGALRSYHVDLAHQALKESMPLEPSIDAKRFLWSMSIRVENEKNELAWLDANWGR